LSIINLLPVENYLIGARSDGIIFKIDKNYKKIQYFEKYKGKRILSFDKFDDSLISITTSDTNQILITNDFEILHQGKYKSVDLGPYFKIQKGNLFDFVAVNEGAILYFQLNPLKMINTRLSDLGFGKKIRELYKFGNEILIDIDGKKYRINEQTFIPELFIIDSSGTIFLKNENNYFDISINDRIGTPLSTIMFSQLVNEKYEQRCVLNYERYIKNDFKINDSKFINDETILSVGTNNTIFISYNSGFQWNIVSYAPFHSSTCLKWLNNNYGFYSSYGGQIFKTSDGGATFLPYKIDSDDLFEFNVSQNTIFDINGNGMGYCYHNSGIQHFSDTNRIYNFLFTEDYGETWEGKWVDGLIGKKNVTTYEPGSFNQLFYKGNYYYNLLDRQFNFSKIVKIQPDEFYNKKTKVDWKIIDSSLVYLLASDSLKLWALICEDNKAIISSTTDTNLNNWKNEFVLNDFTINNRFMGLLQAQKLYIQTYKPNNESFILSVIDTSFNKNIVFDPKSGEIIDGNFAIFGIYSHFYLDFLTNIFKLIKKDTVRIEGIMSINSKGNYEISYKPGSKLTTFLNPFLLYGKNVFFNKISINGNYFNSILSFSSDKIYEEDWQPDWSELPLADFKTYLRLSNIEYGWANFNKINENKFVCNALILEKGETINKVQETEKKDVYMYKYLPYPQPGTNQIKVKIYTNNFDCFNPKTFEVYNSNGLIISNENEFEIVQTGIYEAEIVWDCSKQQSGVYFIKLNCETYNDVIKVIKN
jgi:hypothetical protein